MSLEHWNYSGAAETYDARPDYAPGALARLISLAGIKAGDLCCDMGAGTGRLTIPLLKFELRVDAVEPNREMRELGQTATGNSEFVRWIEASAERCELQTGAYDLVVFGSSFNVTNRPQALKESHRILRASGWFACMWNHRELDDPLQAQIENAIRAEIPSYSYGSRRDDQAQVILESGLYNPAIAFEVSVTHRVDVETWLDAWRSHATLVQQAGDRMPQILSMIGKLVRHQSCSQLEIPYVTRVWAAQSRVAAP